MPEARRAGATAVAQARPGERYGEPVEEGVIARQQDAQLKHNLCPRGRGTHTDVRHDEEESRWPFEEERACHCQLVQEEGGVVRCASERRWDALGRKMVPVRRGAVPEVDGKGDRRVSEQRCEELQEHACARANARTARTLSRRGLST